ncbi:MAG: SPOR domain-containing protein [Spirochaetaceae bacterium]|nr:MAG: SPOR domain-containing protein [Spirochaetaceae bacterium]
MVHLRLRLVLSAVAISVVSFGIPHAVPAQESVEIGSQLIHAGATIHESRALLQDLLASQQDPREVQRIHAMIAELAELAGDHAAAQRSYRRAWDADPHNDDAVGLLLLSAQLRLELGDLDGASAEAAEATTRAPAFAQRSDSALLQARIHLTRDEREPAAATLRSVWAAIEEHGVADAGSARLFVVYDLARQLGLDPMAAAAYSALEQNYPLSVEYALVRSDKPVHKRRVEVFPSPWRLFDALPYADLPGDSPRPAAVAAAPAVGRTAHGIQAGSFRDPENATYLARDISEAGFPAEVRRRIRDGETTYQVVVPLESGTTRERALATMTALKDSGIEGFLLYE